MRCSGCAVAAQGEAEWRAASSRLESMGRRGGCAAGATSLDGEAAAATVREGVAVGGGAQCALVRRVVRREQGAADRSLATQQSSGERATGTSWVTKH